MKEEGTNRDLECIENCRIVKRRRDGKRHAPICTLNCRLTTFKIMNNEKPQIPKFPKLQNHGGNKPPLTRPFVRTQYSTMG